MLRVTGTFLNEISYDIPHQNWGEFDRYCEYHGLPARSSDFAPWKD